MARDDERPYSGSPSDPDPDTEITIPNIFGGVSRDDDPDRILPGLTGAAGPSREQPPTWEHPSPGAASPSDPHRGHPSAGHGQQPGYVTGATAGYGTGAGYGAAGPGGPPPVQGQPLPPERNRRRNALLGVLAVIVLTVAVVVAAVVIAPRWSNNENAEPNPNAPVATDSSDPGTPVTTAGPPTTENGPTGDPTSSGVSVAPPPGSSGDGATDSDAAGTDPAGTDPAGTDAAGTDAAGSGTAGSATAGSAGSSSAPSTRTVTVTATPSTATKGSGAGSPDSGAGNGPGGSGNGTGATGTKGSGAGGSSTSSPAESTRTTPKSTPPKTTPTTPAQPDLGVPRKNISCDPGYIVQLASELDEQTFKARVATLKQQGMVPQDAKAADSTKSCNIFSNQSNTWVLYVGPYSTPYRGCAARFAGPADAFIKGANPGTSSDYISCLCPANTAKIPRLGPGTREASWTGELQRVLAGRLNYSVGTLGPEQWGQYTPGTRDAVRRFQSDNKLPPSGTVDARTWKALQAAEC